MAREKASKAGVTSNFEFVLDASALLIALQNEPGAEIVNAHAPTSVISAVNLSEVAKKLIEKGITPVVVEEILRDLGIFTVDFTTELAFIAAELYLKGKGLGLSLADRACLALAMQHKLPVLTADSVWSKLKLPIKVVLVR